MQHNNKKSQVKSVIRKGLAPLNPPIGGTLAHLAYGHLAFASWRKLKKKSNEQK